MAILRGPVLEGRVARAVLKVVDCDVHPYKHGNVIIFDPPEYALQSFEMRREDIGEQVMILPSLRWRCLRCS
jgi:hypothetical protein